MLYFIIFYVFSVLSTAARNRGALIGRNATLSQRDIAIFEDLSEFRHLIRRCNVLNDQYYRSHLRRIKSENGLSDFEWWLMVSNLDSTSLSLSLIYTVDFQNLLQRAALCQELVFISRSVNRFRYLTRISFSSIFKGLPNNSSGNGLEKNWKQDMKNVFNNCPALTSLTLKNLCNGK